MRRPDSPVARATRASQGRVAAAAALVDVENGSRSEVALRDHLPDSLADRRLSWHIVMGVLRGRGRVDATIRTALKQPLADLQPAVRAVLRVGAFERIGSRTAPHAIVHQAVETARSLSVGRASSLVNAVLRNCRLPEELTPHDAVDHPAWLYARWVERHGEEAATAWCLANNDLPPRFIVARDDVDAVVEMLATADTVARPARIGEQLIERVLQLEGPGGPLEGLPGHDEGHWWVQDAASAWMADLVPAAARRVLDACAAPGGKTLRLATRGAEVVATDVHARRLKRMGKVLDRLRVNAQTLQHDWTTGPCGELGRFDAVLVDAPCTGLGTVRRRPEIRWRRGPFDAAEAAEKQLAILRAAACHVAMDGHLVYVVCSSEPEEGEQVVEQMAKDGWVVQTTRCTAPPLGGEDAFFGARLVRA